MKQQGTQHQLGGEHVADRRPLLDTGDPGGAADGEAQGDEDAARHDEREHVAHARHQPDAELFGARGALRCRRLHGRGREAGADPGSGATGAEPA
ncbi:MAG: hypothetical protein ACRD0S_06650, partial [Acidimicrobiales bacterium]